MLNENRSTNWFGQFRLIAWLGVSHLVAASMGALAIWLAPGHLPLALRLAAAILAGAALGLLLNGPIFRAVEHLTVALGQLAQGKLVASLPTSPQRLPLWLQPLHGLLALVDLLAGREREMHLLRDDLVRSTGQAAAQSERNRLARDLHDSIKQQLYAINVSAAAALARWESDLAGARTAVEDVRRAAQAALAEMAALLQQLRPAPLAAAGLLDALREQCEALAHRTGAEVTVDLGQPEDATAYMAAVDAGRLVPGAEEAIFRIAQEALNNIARHARSAHVALRLRIEGEALHLEIVDDGQGFALPETGDANSGDRPVAGYGLAGMRDRATGIGARLDIISAFDQGTRVSLSVPLGEPAVREEVEMSAEVKSWLQKASHWQTVALAAGGLATVFALSLVPRLAGSAGLAQLISLVLALAGLGVTFVAWQRSRRAALRVTVALGAEHPAVWRMRREFAAARVWAALAALVILPGALMPKSWPQYPVAALAVGLACAVLVAVAIALSYHVTEGYWAQLTASTLTAELDQAWRGRFSWAVVLLVTGAGYFGVYGGFQAPWTWPPSRDLVLDILVTLYINLVLVLSVVSYMQLRSWRGRYADPGANAV